MTHSFPTRRSSDLIGGGTRAIEAAGGGGDGTGLARRIGPDRQRHVARKIEVALGGEAERQPQRGDLGEAERTKFGTAEPQVGRSEERSVGDACVSTCSSRWSPCH